jgi:hypothetical protein
MLCDKCNGDRTYCYTNSSHYKNKRFYCQRACQDCNSSTNPTGITSETYILCPTTPIDGKDHISASHVISSKKIANQSKNK